MSLINPSAEILTLSRAAGDQLAFSAVSIAGTRMTPFWDAPVAAARISPDFVLATNTPVSAKRGYAKFPQPASRLCRARELIGLKTCRR